MGPVGHIYSAGSRFSLSQLPALSFYKLPTLVAIPGFIFSGIP